LNQGNERRPPGRPRRRSPQASERSLRPCHIGRDRGQYENGFESFAEDEDGDIEDTSPEITVPSGFGSPPVPQDLQDEDGGDERDSDGAIYPGRIGTGFSSPRSSPQFRWYAGITPAETRRALKRKMEPSYMGTFTGARKYVLQTFATTHSALMKKRVARYMIASACPVCHGKRLRLRR